MNTRTIEYLPGQADVYSVPAYRSAARGGRFVSARPELRLTFFGSTQITLDGAELSITRRKALALLAYLVVTKTPHSRDALATLFAGETSDDQARKSLRNSLAMLNELVGAHLHITRQTVSFDQSANYWLDVEAFQSAVETALPTTDIPALQAAVNLYQGEFLQGVSLPDAPDYEEWLLMQQNVFRGLLIQALDTLADHYTQHGPLAAGLAAVDRLLALDPWREESHRQKIRLLAFNGQHSAALAQYETCRRILSKELGVEPSPETKNLYERLRTPPAAPAHNLPASLTPFVGRERELALLAEQLAEPNCRLITIQGLGGIGKTRLALQAAAALVTPQVLAAQPFADGIYLVDLSSCDAPMPAAKTPELSARALATTIAQTMGISLKRTASSIDQLLADLGNKHLLLILDNFEDFSLGVGLLNTLLQHAPSIKLLVTSRLRLQLEPEWLLEIAGLDAPQTPNDVEHAGAGRLFLQQARRVQVNAPLGRNDAVHIKRLCDMVQGHPLALLLAAQWLRVMSCVEIVEALGADLDVLATTMRDVPERHRDLQAILTWSWAQLTSAEQHAVRKLSQLKQGFDLEAACRSMQIDRRQALALRDLSLVSRDDAGRFRVHELVRRYTAEREKASVYQPLRHS